MGARIRGDSILLIGGEMPRLLKPRWKRLICRAIGHETIPAVVQTWDDTDGLVDVEDPGRTVCIICGICPEDIAVTRPGPVYAGLASLIGPEYWDTSSDWGDRRIKRPGLWGVREDYDDPPAIGRGSR